MTTKQNAPLLRNRRRRLRAVTAISAATEVFKKQQTARAKLHERSKRSVSRIHDMYTRFGNPYTFVH